MKKIYLLSIIGMFAFHASFGQYQEQEPEPEESPNTVLRLHLLPPGIAVEQAIAEYVTLTFDFQLGFAYSYREVNGVSESSFYTFPTLMLQPRFYTTQKKRERLG